MFLQSPTGLITQSATEGKRSLMIKEDGDYFFLVLISFPPSGSSIYTLYIKMH